MGKIFNALQKFGKERADTVSDRIKDSDYEALMQFDEATGRIDITDPKISKDPRILKRLKTYRLINDNGTLTPAGKVKYEQLKRRHMAAKPQKPAISGNIKAQTPSAAPTKRTGTLTASDWALLMRYDRMTGSLLKYDPETGRLDKDSKNILQDPATVQRLIDNQMILPGGWLTPTAKRQCEKIAEKHERKQTETSVKAQKRTVPDKPAKSTEPLELMRASDMEVLIQYDPETLKLDLKNPAILNDPEIVKRLLENDMINSAGKLSRKALVRCRVLSSWNSEIEAKKPSTAAQQVQKAVNRNPRPAASGETDHRKVKIINLEKDRETENTPERAAAEAAKDTEGQKIERHKGVKPIMPQDAKVKQPIALPEKRKFTLGKTHLDYDRSKIDKNLVSLLNPQSFESEQFKILRTNLLFPASDKSPQSVMVTSVAPGEGKSFVAANLAVSVAQHVNWNVLLVDCDLRRPTMHRQFGFPEVPGLSDYLSRGRELQSLLLKTAVDRLTILPGGRPPSNPSELLSSERMAAFIDEVAARYNDRLIILDSPPPRLTAESIALARHVDGILLVVRYAKTPRDAASELINKLGKGKILGAIVNNFDAGSSRYHKKYYGGEYYK